MIDIMENAVLGPAVLKGEIKIIVFQLELKFGSVPDWVHTKLQAANEDQLMTWTVKLLHAPDLPSIFQD